MRVRVAPTLHPSHIQRGAWEKLYFLVEDLKRANAQAWAPSLQRRPVEYIQHPTPAQAGEFLRIGDPRPLILDIETTGVEDDAEIECCGVARGPGRVACLPMREPFKSMLRSALLDRVSRKVAHNMGFDFPRLERALSIASGIQGEWFDTMEAWAVCQPDLEVRLEILGSMVFDQHPWKGDPKDTKELYNCKDVDATARGERWLTNQMDALGLTKMFHKRVMPALRVLIKMRERGMHIDLGRQAEARELIVPQLDELRRKLNAEVAHLPGRESDRDDRLREAEELEAEAGRIDALRGKKAGQRSREGNKLRTQAKRLRTMAQKLEEVNALSHKQIAHLLYVELGLPSQTTKGKEGLSTDDDALIELWRQTRHPAIPLIRETRELAKLEGTYLSFEEEHIFPRLLLWATGTGRLGCRDPNMQNIPKRGRFAKPIRRMITPRHKGWVFTSADYSQIERRLQALLWRDELLQAAFDKGLDCHIDAASRIFGVPYDSVTDLQRTLAKSTVYGQSYGMGPLKFHRDLAAKGIEVEFGEARRLLQAIAEVYPGVAKGAAATIEEAERNHVLRNPFDRLRWFFGSPHGDALNFPFQSSTADIMLDSMILLDEQLPESAMLVMQVHDEVWIEHPRELTKQVQECTRDIMERRIDELGGWRCPVSVKTSLDWSHQERVEA